MSPAPAIGLIQLDPWLAPYEKALRARLERYRALRAMLEPLGGLLGEVSQGHRHFGLNPAPDGGIVYREWAPGALSLALTGDFNGWDRAAHPLAQDRFGVWTLSLPPGVVPPGSRVKVHVVTDDSAMDRIPAYARRVVQDPHTLDFAAVYTLPTPPPPPLTRPRGSGRAGLRIYEAHVGMAQEAPRIGTFTEFIGTVLPRIARLGYNAVQLMAVQEHPYYGSFGYHVSSFFAVSSRFGTPEDLKALIETAHDLGLRVLMDLVHSHAVKNVLEGLNRFDGTEFQYFHAGPRGDHPAWDSKCFDYAKFEVQRFLLSNVRYWLEEFGFDGFRFDGVTSLLYRDHGLERSFGHYDEYFSANVDPDAVAYLQLANDLVHALRPDALTIAEEVSGMPGLARATAEGGLGFDYRLAMGVPDFWIKLLKEKRDEEWNLADLWHTLLNRRAHERHVGYAESHDQALVGDKTLAFWLMDASMYTDMAYDRQSLIVDRGIALHKLIRLLTFGLAGEAWLCFMGNEFGHPEWIDFPREGNGWSYAHARRQWSLVDNPFLRYGGLLAFDAALQRLDDDFGVLQDPFLERLYLHEERKLLVWRRGPLVFAVNLHPTESCPDLRLPVPDRADYRVVLDTDRYDYAGPGRIASEARYTWEPVEMEGRGQSVRLYLPNRSGLVLAPAS